MNGAAVLQFVDVARSTCGDRLLVELERLSDVVEDAEVVDDETVRLARALVGWCGRWPGAGVVPQRLVEVHCLEIRCVETGEQLGSDDEDLERVAWVAEAVEELLLLVLRAVVAFFIPGSPGSPR